jgi:cytosine/adenosine deaminase-related metal-dependent hydrolase
MPPAPPGSTGRNASPASRKWGLPWRPHTAGDGLAALIENKHRGRAELAEAGVTVAERAANLLSAYVAAGTSHIRRGPRPGRLRPPAGRASGRDFAIADPHGCGLDIHLHEGGELARAALLAWRTGARSDEDLAAALEVGTSGGAAVLGLNGYGLTPGFRADLSLAPAKTVGEAVVTHPPRTLVSSPAASRDRHDNTDQAHVPCVCARPH